MRRLDGPGPGQPGRLRVQPGEQVTLLHLPSGRAQKSAAAIGPAIPGPGTYQTRHTHHGKTVVGNTTGFVSKTESVLEKLTRKALADCGRCSSAPSNIRLAGQDPAGAAGCYWSRRPWPARSNLRPWSFLSGWGLAVVDSVEGATQSAAGHCWALLERWKQTEDRHFAVPPLRWATTFFAECGDAAGTRACAAALVQIAADAGQDEGDVRALPRIGRNGGGLTRRELEILQLVATGRTTGRLPENCF
jgi:hypothetical protein